MSNVVVLSEAMQTRYIINALNGRFERVMNLCVDNGSTVDLVGCKFGPACAAMLHDYFGKINIINSREKELNAILSNNCAYMEEEIPDYEPLELDKNGDIDYYLDLIRTLPAGRYEPIISSTDIAQRAGLILLIMGRPDIEFDIRKYSMDIFAFVRDGWVSSAESHDSYYELITPDVVRRDRTSDNKFGAIDYGYMSEMEFCSKRTVLPIEFGNSQIINLENPGVSEEWTPTVNKCINVFERKTSPRRVKGKTCLNYLKFRGDE